MKSDLVPGGKLLVAYYAATAAYMAMDYLFGVNLRLTFLDPYPGWRLIYYVFCFLCLGMMLWKPAWRSYVAAGESLLTLSMIILSTAVRVVIVDDDMIEGGRGFLGLRELVNFVVTSTVVYISYSLSLQAAREH